jgi:hypothetical protein
MRSKQAWFLTIAAIFTIIALGSRYVSTGRGPTLLGSSRPSSNATKEYWERLNNNLVILQTETDKCFSVRQRQEMDSSIEAAERLSFLFTNAARVISATPIRDVDAAAIDHAAKFAQIFSEVGAVFDADAHLSREYKKFILDQDLGVNMVIDLTQWLRSGSSENASRRRVEAAKFDSRREDVDAGWKKFIAQRKQLVSDEMRVRAGLNERYGCEFPTLSFY